MNAELERDLGAWERGEMDRERLVATHGEAAAGTVALHERLADLAATTGVPNAEAGWAALLLKLEAPAPVVPLRRNARRRRTLTLLVAAALVVAGAAFAATWGSTHRGTGPAPSGTSVSAGPSTASGSFGPSDRRLVPPPNGAIPDRHDGTGPSSGGGTSGDTVDGSKRGGDGPTSTDDPHDRDQGTGNDGSHDDNGSGNDGRSGTLPHGSHGASH